MRQKVSVVLPFHKLTRELILAVESVCASVNIHGELLLISDGPSVQDTEKFLARVREGAIKIKVLRSPGSGISAALNFGIASSAFNYVARMDSDDICTPSRLIHQIAMLESHKEIAVCGTQVEYICTHGFRIGKSRYRRVTKRGIKPLQGTPIAHPTALFRKNEFTQVGGYSSDFPHAEDFDLWQRFHRLGDIVILDQIGLKYRIHSDQVSQVHKVAQQRSVLKSLEVSLNGWDSSNSTGKKFSWKLACLTFLNSPSIYKNSNSSIETVLLLLSLPFSPYFWEKVYEAFRNRFTKPNFDLCIDCQKN